MFVHRPILQLTLTLDFGLMNCPTFYLWSCDLIAIQVALGAQRRYKLEDCIVHQGHFRAGCRNVNQQCAA